jgi:hypothetical protein
MSKIRNVFEAITRFGHDEDFAPAIDENFEATDHPAGSVEKIDVLRRRVELGLPLWHDADRIDYTEYQGVALPSMMFDEDA